MITSQRYSRFTYSLPLRPIVRRSRSSASSSFAASTNSSRLSYQRPAWLRRQCSTSTSLWPLQSTGVPTAIASSASSDRLSKGDGTTTMVARLQSLEPLALRQQPGEAHPRHLGQLHQLHAHQHQVGVAGLLLVAGEVLEQLLAALARDRCGRRTAGTGPGAGGGAGIGRRAAPGDWAARSSSLVERRAARRIAMARRPPMRGPARRRDRRAAGARTAGVAARQQIDAAADDFLGRRGDLEAGLEELPLDFGVVGDGRRQAEHLLVDARGEWPARRAPSAPGCCAPGSTFSPSTVGA